MSNSKLHWQPIFASGLSILTFARMRRNGMRMLESAHEVLDLGAGALFDDFGDPAAVAVLVIALIAENADGPGSPDER
jgi:hypothetical protein